MLQTSGYYSLGGLLLSYFYLLSAYLYVFLTIKFIIFKWHCRIQTNFGLTRFLISYFSEQKFSVIKHFRLQNGTL